MEKKTNKGKLEIFKFLRDSVLSPETDNFIGGNYVLSANSLYKKKYAYQGIFACRIHICNENSSKSYDFREKCQKKKNRKMISFGNFC